MVGRIDNNYNNPYNNNFKTKNIDKDAPAFLLNYDDNGVIWDRSTDKKTNVKKQEDDNRQDIYEKSDVVKDAAKEEPVQKSTPLQPGATVKGVLSQIFSGFKKLFEFIWYGEDKKKVANDVAVKEDTNDKTPEIVAQDKETVVYESKNEPRILKLPAKEKSLTPNELRLREVTGKKVARNTSLLTYYNKYGRIVDVGGSESSRILYGEKNVRTL